MNKSLTASSIYNLSFLLFFVIGCATITPKYILPVQTTQGVITDYALALTNHIAINQDAQIKVTFPFQFDPRALTKNQGCKIKMNDQQNLISYPCTLSNRTFTIPIGQLYEEQQITILVIGVQNPTGVQLSSDFNIATLFKNVIVDKNLQFGKTVFTKAPINTESIIVNNYQNLLIDQGSSWTFQFNLLNTYPTNSTLRFIFPQGFKSFRIQCQISGIANTSVNTRVFPQLNIYDCLNINKVLSGSQKVKINGIVNPQYAMTFGTSDLQVHILKPNNLVVVQKLSMSNSISISHKNMNATVTVPNKYRNNTQRYTFEINMDSDLSYGDYFEIKIDGNWVFYANQSTIIQGIVSTNQQTAIFQANYTNIPTTSILYIKNFSSVSRSNQIALYVSVKTPLTSGDYDLQISAKKYHGGLVQKFNTMIEINSTTGYIKQIRMHPMIKAYDLPASQTGPLQIILGLLNNLPQTNVLSYGKIKIQIFPKIPYPPASNGVPKCYWYGNIQAQSCTYDDSTDKTIIEATTPTDYNFQSSQFPFMVTTQGYIDQSYQGLTIDSLVKRYNFQIQFFDSDQVNAKPTEVIFSSWQPNPLNIDIFQCETMTSDTNFWDHLICNFTTPPQDLNQPNYQHIFRLQFIGDGWDTNLGYSSDQIYPNFPCLVYGTNVQADPYVKCDLITWKTGPYASESATTYINMYGFELLSGGSVIKFEIPMLKRSSTTTDNTKVNLAILQETWGQSSPTIRLYSSQLELNDTQYRDPINLVYISTAVTATLSNPVVNKLSDITLSGVDLGIADADYIIFEVDQSVFENIGRQEQFACGSHLCSKFDQPVQYFIVYPQNTLTQIQTLVFPDIITPKYAGSYQFKLRVYKDNTFVKHISFDITVQPQQLSPPVYSLYSPLQTAVSSLFPNTNHYYSISFTTLNSLPEETGYIQIILDNIFTIADNYCQVITSVSAADKRGIECEVWVGQDTILIQNMEEVPSSSNFQIILLLTSSQSSPSVTPTVSITTYYQPSKKVDFFTSGDFTPASFAVTNLQTMNNFIINTPQIIERQPQADYFGPLLLHFKAKQSSVSTSGYYLIVTLTSDFHPYVSALNLPLSCKINTIRLQCSYTINPFVVTIKGITNKFVYNNDNLLNITTEFQEHDGIYYPSTQGKYLLNLHFKNSGGSTLEKVEQYIDILPKKVEYFNVSFAHRDRNQENIFQIKFRNGPNTIPAFNHGTTAARIYIGFPTADSNSATVFSDDLGFVSGTGSKIPCWFNPSPNYITALATKNLECRLIKSTSYPQYAYVQIINFDTISPNQEAHIIIGKILNPAAAHYDINFQLKITTQQVSTKEETPLYLTYFNMFFNMKTASKTLVSQADSTTSLFDPTAQVGDLNKYMYVKPYTTTDSQTFSSGDWYVLEMYDQFQLTDSIQVSGCMKPYYDHCIVFPEINWLMVKIGNTTILDLQAYISQMPSSLSRISKSFKAYTFKNSRFSQEITYTITEARWSQLQGSINNFEFSILGSGDKINLNKKKVQVMIQFDITHQINRQGSIQIRFPQNPLMVPNIQPHCRSAVSLGSELNGDATGKSIANVQGEIGCLVQNDYSWVITSFDAIDDNSHIKIIGLIDLPTTQTTTLGTGQIITYGDTHSSDTRNNARIIDYSSVNFPLEITQQSWSVDSTAFLYRSEPLRIGFIGEFKFKLNTAQNIQSRSLGGSININLWKRPTMGTNTNGFNGPTSLSSLVCKIKQIQSQQFYGCDVVSASSANANFVTYQIMSFETLSANKNYIVTLTTQTGITANDGINFPTSEGIYKVETQIKYSTANSQQVSQVHFVEVYGPNFNILQLTSTISIPDQLNLILVTIKPPSTIQTNHQLIIQIPTVSIEGEDLFSQDLGMNYEDYDDLQFDMYQSSISSMSCKVYTGDSTNNKPVKIICSSFNTAITSTMTLKFGFWVKNPNSSKGLALPIFVYAYNPIIAAKYIWTMIEAGIRILPTSNLPISDTGNFALGTTQRQTQLVNFDLTTRNTNPLQKDDLYIIKFNFDLRKQDSYTGKFKYNSGLSNSGDVIFLRNCKTIILRVGLTQLDNVNSASSSINARIQGLFFTPQIQLSQAQSKILSYVAYLQTKQCQKIIYTDDFPQLVPKQILSPLVTFSEINSNLYKKSREDYKISVKASTSDTGNDMNLAKKISITLSSNLVFSGTECIQHVSSTIQIQKCIIDPTTKTIWMNVIQNSAYQNNDQLLIETKGLAINNPSTNVDTKDFIIKYYTWSDLSEQPSLSVNSQDYVFLRQDASNLPTNVITYEGSAYTLHDKVSINQDLYINEYLPPSNDLNKKTPFQFLFKAQSNFNDLANSANYHKITVKFNDYYTYSSQTVTNDLSINIPICQLNGARINLCSISSGVITMNFQQALVAGTQYSVKFSILNPKQPEDDGFSLINTNTETATLPIQIWEYSGTKYYAEAEPFPTYHRINSVYPEQGIYDVSLTYGTEVYDKINYLQFTIKFSRSDITGLVLEIPVKNSDGTIIYTNPQMFALPSGSKFPCSVGIDLDVFCFYEQGTSNGYGKPTRIYISQFSIQAGNQLSFRMLFKNPQLGVRPSFIFKAYTGTKQVPHVIGRQFVGSFGLYDAFKTIPQSGHTSTSTCSMRPNKGLWNRQTSYSFYQTVAQNAGQYAIAEWQLTHQTYGQIAQYEVVTADINDYFIIRYADNHRVLYLVKKFGSNYAGGSNYYNFGYLRQKHFLDNSFAVYLLKKPDFATVTCTVDLSYYQGNQMNNYGTPTMVGLDIQDKLYGQTSWQYLQIDMGSPQNMLLKDQDKAEMILIVKFVSNKPFQTLGSSQRCSIQTGVTSLDKLTPVTCSLDSSNDQFIIYNINKFTGANLIIYYEATLTNSDFTNTNVQIRAFANQAAFNNNNWALWKSTTSNGYSITTMSGYSDNPGDSRRTSMSQSQDRTKSATTFRLLSNVWTNIGGSVKILDMSDDYIVFRITRGDSNMGGQNNYYRVSFEFYVEKINFGSCTNFQIYSHRLNTWNFHNKLRCETSGHMFRVIFREHSSSNNHDWPQWNSGQSYDIYGYFSGNTGYQYPDSHGVYVSASMVYQQLIYKTHSSCGCNYNYDYGYCNYYYACYFNQGYGTTFFTGRNTEPYPDENNANSLASSGSIDLVSRQKNIETELMLSLDNINVNVGPSYGSYLLMKFDDLPTFPSNNPFPDTYSNDLNGAYIDCKCVKGSSIVISHSTSYQTPKCVRYVISNTNSVMASSIGIWIDVAQNQDLKCYFPGFRTNTDSVLNVDVFHMSDLYFPKVIPIDNYWSRYAIFDLQETLTNVGYSSMSISQNSGFWSDRKSYDTYSGYQLSLSGDYINDPTVYISTYAPKPITSFCTSSAFNFCRVYTSFLNRRYYIITQRSTYDSNFLLSGNVNFPPANDESSGYYKLFAAWGTQSSSEQYYRRVYSSNRDKNQLSPSTPTFNGQPNLFGSILKTYGTTIVFLLDLNGRNLYSYQRDGDQYDGSFLKLTVPSATLLGCSATLQSGPYTNKNSLSCTVSGSTIQIRAFQDISFTTGLHVFVSTSSMPSTTACKIELFDKYMSSSDFSRSVDTTKTFSNNPSGYTIIPVTDIKWRKQVYKQYLVSSAPIRFTFKNNYEYVYDEATQGNSDGLQIKYPSGGISLTDKYICYVKQYPQNKKYLYKQFELPCYYQTTDTIQIIPMKSYSLKPQFEYQVVIYKNLNGVNGLITTNTNSVFISVIRSISSKSANTVINQNFVLNHKYQSVKPLSLNSIYILNKQAGVKNSLYLDFAYSNIGTNYQYLQFQFDKLGLSSFQITNGQKIPCYLDSTDFTSISGTNKKPECRGYSHGINLDSPLIIRVMNFDDSFSAGNNFQLAFDNFNNPAQRIYQDTPVNIRARMIDRTNNKLYSSYFPSVYISDSFNIATPTQSSGTLTNINSKYGATQNQRLQITWPYSSNSADLTQKIAVQIEGGILCCQLFQNLNVYDNVNGSWALLWRNTETNISIYKTPTLSSTTRYIYISNVINPYPTRKQTYESGNQIYVRYYKNYQTEAIINQNQMDFTSYTYDIDLDIQNQANPVSIQGTKSYNYHNGYPMIYDFTISSSYASYSGRNLDKLIIRFTEGINHIEQAYLITAQSPYIVNTVLQPKIYKQSVTNYWCIKLLGLDDSIYSNSDNWIIRIRFYANANIIKYQGTVYADNGEIQFVDDIETHSVYNDGYRSTGLNPLKFELYQQRYIYGNYQMQRTLLTPKTSLVTNRLNFRFIAPYDMQSTESLSLNLDTTSQIIPKNTPASIICIFQPSHSSQTVLGIGLYSQCSYSNGIYSISIPIGGLNINQQYTLSILEDNQLNSQFIMPNVPKRHEISLIYNTDLGIQYNDTYILDFSGKMIRYSVDHLTLKAGEYNTIGFTFKPSFDMIAASRTSPITQSILQISLQSRYFQSCLGVNTYYSNDGMYFESGTYFSHFSTPVQDDASTRLLCGQYSQSYAPVKLTVTDYLQYTNNNEYYFRFTLIKNPVTQFTPLIYKVRLLHYQNNKHFPIIISQYQYNNLQQVSTGSQSTQSLSVGVSNQIVQQNMPLSITYSSYNPPIGTQIHVKFKNNEIKAFESILPMKTLSQTNFTEYEYYPNINLGIFRKTAGSTDSSISLGTYSLVDDQQSFTISWVYAYPNNNQIVKSSFGGSTSKTTSTTIAGSSFFTTNQITKVTGSLTTTNSMGIYRISFQSSLQYQENGYMIISISSNFQIVEDKCKQTSGFSISSNNHLVCQKYSSTQILVKGYATIAADTALSVTLYLKLAVSGLQTYSNTATINAYSSTGKQISSGQSNTFSFTTTHQGSNYIRLHNNMYHKLTKDSSSQFQFSFSLALHTLTTGGYIIIDFDQWTIDLAQLQGRVIWRYKVGSNIYWIPADAQNVIDNIYKLNVYQNFNMIANQQIRVKISHQLPDSYIGIKYNQIQWNRLKIQAYDLSDTLLEHQYAQIWIQPEQHHSLNVNPILKYVGAQTVYEFQFTPNVSANIGDKIALQFTTSDGFYSQIFDDSLGFTISANSSKRISCHQIDHSHIISDDTQLPCQIFAGDSSQQPPIPATIIIPISKSISAGTQIKWNILNIQNPSITDYPIQITVKLMDLCDNMNQNKPCTYYRSTHYITFVSPPGTIPTVSVSGLFSADNDLVSATNVQHTLSNADTIDIGDYLKIIYYPQITIPSQCTLTSGNGVCYSYPEDNTIIVKASIMQNGYSFSFSGMTNLYQKKGSTCIYTQIWDASSATIKSKYNTDYTYTPITIDPTTLDPLTMEFIPTRTPNYQLKYGFPNIVRIDITHLMQNQQIEMLYLQAPSEITFLTRYCNATLQSSVLEASPYPYRFECKVVNARTAKIIKLKNFPEFDQITHPVKNVSIHLTYYISSGDQSVGWLIKAYTQDILNDNYLVSQATGGFTVDPYLHPQIYKINFYTQSFQKRSCKTNQKCMLYGYLLPSTDKDIYQIKYITYTIPKQFGYSSETIYDICKLEKNSDEIYNDLVQCSATRNNSQVVLTHVPTPGYYHHEYQLVTIDQTDQSLLFISPYYPGSHYQMKVNLFSTDDQLLETMMVNLTSVYGQILDQDKINIDIPLDAQHYGLFKFKFEVGQEDIPPGYQSSQNNKIVSQIHLQFSKSFEDDIGTDKKWGQQVACIPISGMLFFSTGKLTCRIYPSYSTTTYPRIQLTGYDRIVSGVQVVFMIAGLKTLPASVDDFIKIGVSLIYYDYGNAQGYLYELTGFVVGGTSALSSVIPINSLVVVQSSSNYVGQLVNYTFTGTMGAGFGDITPTDYVSIQFEQDCFEGVFNENSLVASSISTGTETYSFGLSSIVYFQPTTTISSSSLSFSLNNMINSAYSIEYAQKSFKITTYTNNKINAQGTATLVKFSKPSQNITAIISQLASIYGGDTDINYTFQFKLNSYIPKYGLITIEFPQIYQSLYSLNSLCILSQILQSQSVYCEIINSKTISILANGFLFQSDIPYSITVTNITNPNSELLKQQQFVISTYHDENIYQGHIISSSSFSPPQISLITIKDCETFQVTLGAYNPNYVTSYDLTLICSSLIKAASSIKIYISWETEKQDSLSCESSTQSLYAEQCSIGQQYKQGKKYRFLQAYLRQISPQKLILFSASLKSPEKGTYSFEAQISYKGFTYIKTTSKSFFITEDIVQNSTLSLFHFKNYPKNRDENSIFVFNLTNIYDSTDILKLELPSSLYVVENQDLQCLWLGLNFSQNYFNLLKTKDDLSYITLPCSFKQNNLILSNISESLAKIASDNPFRIAVYSIINPPISSIVTLFSITYLRNQSSFPSAIATQSFNRSYQVSETPSNLLIDSFTSSSYKLNSKAVYTIQLLIMSGNPMKIPGQTQIGIIIEFPEEYDEIWQEIKKPQSITAKFDSLQLISTQVQKASKIVMSRFKANSEIEFVELQIEFLFRNPKSALDCSITPIFKVALYNFKLNNILAETLGNNVQCPQFKDRNYQIQIVGNNNIEAGSAQIFTISLERPSAYLKIQPQTSISAIEFEPSYIQFTNYTTTSAKLKIKATDSISGAYNITFLKTQEGSNIYFEDIEDQQIKVISPAQKYQITISQVDTKSVGLSIPLQINLSHQSSREITLLYSNNCTQLGYQLNPSLFINIPAGTTHTQLNILYTKGTIPQMCVIDFEISSLSRHNYILPIKRLYISASLSIDKSEVKSIMRIKISQQVTLSRSVGFSILTQPSQSLKPKIYDLRNIEIFSNSGNFQASVSEPGTLYFAALKIGVNRNNVRQQQIYAQNISSLVSYGSKETSVLSSSVAYISQFTIDSLLSQTTYLIAAYLNSSVGISDIEFIVQKTQNSANGASIKIALKIIQDFEVIEQAISIALAVSMERLTVLAYEQILQEDQSTFSSNVMNQRQYIYEIVLGPNQYGDTLTPIKVFQELSNNVQTKQKLLEMLPSLVIQFDMPFHQIILEKPKFRPNTPLSVIILTSSTVTIKVSMWYQALVSAIIVKKSELPSSSDAIYPLVSQQIIEGYTPLNQDIIEQHRHHRVIASQNNNFEVQLQFQLLEDDEQYIIYVTAESVVPYEPKLVIDNKDILEQEIRTQKNLNLMKNEDDVVEILKEIIGQEWAADVEQQIKNNQRKQQITGTNKNKKTRIFKE